jgi:hypothetical protein
MLNVDLKNGNYARISSLFPEIRDYYYVNPDGQIYSAFTNTFLNGWLDKDGYVRQLLRLKVPNPETKAECKVIGVHKIVNTVFNGLPPKGMESPVTDHIDGNIKNNKAENLRWVSRKDNSSHSYKHAGISSIEDYQIVNIFDMHLKEHKSINEIAEHYNSNAKFIHAILTGSKRKVALERYGLTPIKPKAYVTPEEVDKIIYDYLTNPDVPKTEIARRNNTTVNRVHHIVYKDSFKERSEYIDFDNRNIEYDPNNNQIQCEEDFHLMNEFYTQYEYNPNEENCLDVCDIESGNTKEVTIGETEYYTNWQ